MDMNCERLFFANNLAVVSRMRWKCGMTATANSTSGAAGRDLQKITTSTKAFFMSFDFHIGTSKFDVKIYDGTQCQKKYEAED
jgi:hypothetical protein